jgi:hypothetical protein
MSAWLCRKWCDDETIPANARDAWTLILLWQVGDKRRYEEGLRKNILSKKNLSAGERVNAEFLLPLPSIYLCC